jgi:hypothetical protein
MPGKRVQFDQETGNALDLLAKDSMPDFQDLADEAFTDLLNKHGRPVDLKTALRRVSARSKSGRRPHRSGAATLRGRPAAASEGHHGDSGST